MDLRGLGLDGLPQALPALAQLGRAGVIGQGRCVKERAMNTEQDVGEGDLHGWTGQEVTAGLAANTLHDLGGLQFDEDLDQIIGRDGIFAGDFFDADGFLGSEAAGKGKDRARGVVTFNGQFQRR